LESNSRISPPQAATQTPIDQPPEDGAEDLEVPLDWQAFVPTDTADHLATMDRAARDSGCGVPWHLLAAIARDPEFALAHAWPSAVVPPWGMV